MHERPPLPDPQHLFYTAEQMRAHGDACVRAVLKHALNMLGVCAISRTELNRDNRPTHKRLGAEAMVKALGEVVDAFRSQP